MGVCYIYFHIFFPSFKSHVLCIFIFKVFSFIAYVEAFIFIWQWKWKLLSRVLLFAIPRTIQSMEFSRPEYWSGSLSLLQGIFPTQGSNPGLLHCRWILYHLSHKGSPRILEWVAYPFSSGSSETRNPTRVSCIAGDSLPTELTGNMCSLTGMFYNFCNHLYFLSHSVVFDPLWLYGLQPGKPSCPGNSPGKNTGVGCHSLLKDYWCSWI